MIELRNISKRFGRVQANDQINIKVEPGTIHAIVGENGAGKSTAMRIAYGFYTADSGEILISGQAGTITTPSDAIALGIGMVHQHFMLVETMVDGRERRPRCRARVPVRSLDLAAAAARAFEAVREFKLAPWIACRDRGPVGRPAAARRAAEGAVYRHAQLLILDEPTAVLTPQEVEEFFAILRRHARAGQDHRHHHAQAGRSAGDLRRRDGDARREGRWAR